MNTPRKYVLGLDLGVTSIGWALVSVPDREEDSRRLLRAGVHLFQAGIEAGKNTPENALKAGREESKAKVRRLARSARRRGERRTRRKRKLLHALIRLGFYPKPTDRLASPLQIDTYLKGIDRQLRDKWLATDRATHVEHQLLPYRLRALALDQPLEPIEIGRALYHIAQRRGFFANQKTDLVPSSQTSSESDSDNNDEAEKTEKDDALGKVKAGIQSLNQAMAQSGARTLGEFFASLDPTDPETERIRGRYTDREMYKNEFVKIWEAQQQWHPQLMTAEAKETIRKAIFFQRPLKSARHLVGNCSLFPGLKRARVSSRLFQRFRMLQQLNDLEIIPTKKVSCIETNSKTGKTTKKKIEIPDPSQTRRRLTPEERSIALQILERGDAKFADLRQAGAAPEASMFNFEERERDEKRLIGLRTDAKLRTVFGERWDQLEEDEREAIYQDCISIQLPYVLKDRAIERWGLDPEAAERLAALQFEPEYAAYSTKALKILVPELEQGESLNTILNRRFPDRLHRKIPVFDFLPPLQETEVDFPSPAVRRALTEMRKVVNAIIRRFGKPEHIRIELLRELKKGKKQRKAISKRANENESEKKKARADALQKFPELANEENVSEDFVEKIRLANECNWICPYTGKSFGWSDLFKDRTVDVEHIWPRSRSLDNSFANKTLCYVDENRQVKKNRMPSEAYDPAALEQIVSRVKRFKSRFKDEKVRRFLAQEIPAEFTNRHFNESSYIARSAARYVSYLYGGSIDDERTRRVHVTSGGVTGWLRRLWNLNQILGDNGEKNRSDHRHHAVDAIVVALTDAGTIAQLQRAAAQAENLGQTKLFNSIDSPIDVQQVKTQIGGIVVSYRQDRRVRGKLHDDSIYSKNFGTIDEPKHRIRKAIDQLSENELDQIVDRRIREAVISAYEEQKRQGAKNISQAFADPAKRPLVKHGDRQVRIRRVRIETTAKPRQIGGSSQRKMCDASNVRYVKPASNHHVAIYESVDRKGKIVLVEQVVTMLDALERVKKGQPVIDRQHPCGKFLFSLATGDYVEIDDDQKTGRIIVRIINISSNDYECIRHNDSRTSGERKKDRIRLNPRKWIERRARKVHVTYLGEVLDDNR